MRPALLAVLNRRLGNFDDAEDAAQETFLKCWRSRDVLPAVRDLRAWIFRIACNTASDLRRNAFRRRARPLSVIGASLKAYEPGPDVAAEEGEAEKRLGHALFQLRLDEKEVFLLRRHEGWTYQRIATLRRTRESTVKSQMRAAIAKLRLVLQDN
jgi:RNA polymerase sigma-70 factor, ECF subfamily